MILIDLPYIIGSDTSTFTLQVEHLISIEPIDNNSCKLRIVGGTFYTIPINSLEVKNKLLELNKTYTIEQSKLDSTDINLTAEIPKQTIEIVMKDNQVVFTKSQIILFIVTMVALLTYSLLQRIEIL